MANGSNGAQNTNPKKIWTGTPKKVDSNIVNKKAPVKFSAKRDSFKGGK